MKHTITFLLFLLTSTVQAQWAFDNTGGRVFDMRKNDTTKTTITFKSVPEDQVQKECDTHSKKLGNGGFNFVPLACTFWTKNSCTVITAHKVDMRTIGHEVMHCLQGNWHD